MEFTHIYFKDYKNESFNLSPIEEQKSIVKILGKTENIIIERKEELNRLDELIKDK